MTLRATFSTDEDLRSVFEEDDQFSASFGSCSQIINLDYQSLYNRPLINHVELIGDKSGDELHLQDHMDEITNIELQNLLQ